MKAVNAMARHGTCESGKSNYDYRMVRECVVLYDSIEARQKRQQKLEGRVDVLMSNWQA